ncbi:Glycerophosphoryl diester phosphodiesterase [Rubrobacter radiotolerans]|uniref:Glycerophosphodiester phosphodiesterase n=1 Tax=Rubrobacter radiotolerans TaxID=42256 RepID=A0A023X4G6_RUBRA|nr:glycerophosphodiester phosphodiesterase [Rubrobacter radiotolerans]AHY47061.1 Glycerophosphoryl diester phosphodiesterase [Rubrobacter radiotolerans]MDX5894467.1 glycerophosphodiester phosphodiesterase [Rubrobacter radiotolerans]SMC06062.1 glycerophosphoryl diester phosphodiesterase [Rubrobacter radiotolerans DSM 5868]
MSFSRERAFPKASLFFLLAAALAVVFALASGRRVRKTADVAGGRSGATAGFAHRGDSSRAPENTLEAFRLAGEGFWLEMDAHLTADGEAVVIHDATVDRTTDGRGRVRATTLAELQRLDAGHNFIGERGGHPWRGRGVRVPALREVYRELPEAHVNVEVKTSTPGTEGEVVRVVHEAGAAGRTLIASGDHRRMVRLREEIRRAADGEPERLIPTSASAREIRVFFFASLLGLERLVPVRYAALQVPARHGPIPVVTRRFVRAAHARGVRMDVWTVNDEAGMRRLVALGVDGIMTDRPQTLRRVLGEKSRS